MNNLPAPETVSELYQAAILAELQAICDLLSPRPGALTAETLHSASVATQPVKVELKEPAKTPSRKRR